MTFPLITAFQARRYAKDKEAYEIFKRAMNSVDRALEKGEYKARFTTYSYHTDNIKTVKEWLSDLGFEISQAEEDYTYFVRW